MRRIDRALALAAGSLIGVYFWRLIRPTLKLYFSSDDLMNLYVSWYYPRSLLLAANLEFWRSSRFGRPLASVWYRTIYHFAGFRPGAFHAVDLAVLTLNVYLTYALCRRLSGSREIGAVAALIGCYNARLAFLYFDTGYIYDVLCYCFYCAAFLLYLRARQQNRQLKPAEMAALCVLTLCALNSKETAVTLPVILLVYELIYHSGELRRRITGWLPIALCGTVSLIFTVGRWIGPNAVAKLAGYQQIFTWHQFMTTSQHFFGDLTDLEERFQPSWVLLLWALLAVIAWAAKSRCLRFAWCFLMLTPPPLAFLYPRGASQYYIPWFGWVLYCATLLVEVVALATRTILQMLPRQIPQVEDWLPRVRGGALLLVLAVLLHAHFKRVGIANVGSETMDGPLNRALVTQLHRLNPQLPHGSRLLFLNDPIRADWWNLLFLVQLSYHDRSLLVDRIKQMDRPPDARELTTYDHIFDYRDNQFVEVSHR